ncbi:bacteriocin family protein [Kocuria sp. cx-455]|uniref:family 1 encapsulin nanocompartment shell protein n=1 Tax=unclassified Candidatus Sulfotelmatobacter TaxID=2635724 RepID=UPI0016876F94|nr:MULTISPECIES: family 1 encapsulin nanocompartment shell protein [unclassified Candidatus Sulfotelmatobacter]MBD2763225.1 bacteriocin family protein [Kocuria sp. cx-116]MBD2765795.1 bacteriocin family protein [Kocuria sp. cx-455]
MSTNHLLRTHAPISDGNWSTIDSEATERLSAALGARKLVDFAGPHGWDYSATNLGRVTTVQQAPVKGVRARQRQVLPLVEARVGFSLSRDELLDDDRGAADADLGSLDDAAYQMASLENIAVFHGWSEVGIQGIAEVTPHPHIDPVPDIEDYRRRVAKAVKLLHTSGIDGPYALALGPSDFTAIMETSEHGGFPLFDHVRKILGGPIVWTPGVRGGVVLSLRGGDFLFESGEDLAVGYDHHDGQDVFLYLEQSFSFRVATPEAAVVLASTGDS